MPEFICAIMNDSCHVTTYKYVSIIHTESKSDKDNSYMHIQVGNNVINFAKYNVFITF